MIEPGVSYAVKSVSMYSVHDHCEKEKLPDCYSPSCLKIENQFQVFDEGLQIGNKLERLLLNRSTSHNNEISITKNNRGVASCLT